MAKSVDYDLQDASTLINRVEENREALTQKGYSSAKEDALKAAFNEAKQKNGTQLKAVKLVNEKTGEQNNAFDIFLKLIVKIQSAAKSALGNNSGALNKYRVGEKQPTTVKKLLSWGEYFTSVLLEDDEILLANGLTQTDLTDFSAAYSNVASADTTQESAKKLQAAATIARDAAVKKLKDQVFKTRSFVKAAFGGNDEMLIQFKPIPKGRGGSSGDQPPVDPPNP